MNLIIYACCRESDRNPDEQPVKVEWSENVPVISSALNASRTPEGVNVDLISMGSENRWFALDITPYGHGEDTIYFVQVHPHFLTPPRTEWTSSNARPEEVIHIELSGVGEPILGFAFNVLGRSPQVGTRLMNYQSTDHPTLMTETPSHWVIDHYDEFLPETEAPYKAIYLSWCKAAESVG